MSRPRQVVPFPKSRRVIVDVGRVTSRRPTVYGLIQADITDALARLDELDLSVTAFVVATFARAIVEFPEIHALRDWRGRLILFEQPDITVSVEVQLEGRSFPLSHIIRAAGTISVKEATDEIRRVQATPSSSPSLEHMRSARLFVALPGPVRRSLLRLLYRLPDWHRRIMGTAGVSSVGMFGKGAGWAMGLPIHPVNLLVGGIATEERLSDGSSSSRSLMSLTLGFDHDVIDGAPAGRFTSRFKEMLEEAEVLEE